MTAVLSISGLAVSFGGNRVLRDVTLDVPPGCSGLVGPNGAGKTTVFNVVNGYVRPDGGTVELEGRPLVGLAPPAIARLGVGRTFQTPKLVGGATVLENVLLGGDGRLGAPAHLRSLLGSRRQSAPAARRARELLELFGIAGRAGDEARSLPLATQKVVEVARALMARPRLVLLDEPAAGLAAGDVDALVGPLMEFVTDAGLAVVVIEHDLALVSRLCARVAVIHQGTVLAAGAPGAVMAHPDVIEAYLGAGFAAVGE